MTWEDFTRKLSSGVNEPSDARNLSGLERQHLPAVSAPRRVTSGEPFDVSVRVGCPECHPNEEDHHVRSVELCADDQKLFRAQFAPGGSLPRFTCRIRLHQPVVSLRVYAHCSRHGTWLGRHRILVVPKNSV